MRSVTRGLVAFGVFLLCASAPGSARADSTITGTVGEMGIVNGNQYQVSLIFFRFKLTDVSQTKSCTGAGYSSGIGPGYAYFSNQSQNQTTDIVYHELYAMLLLSKKGATINCTINNTTECHITGCTLL